jgi:hypothetical protein
MFLCGPRWSRVRQGRDGKQVGVGEDNREREVIPGWVLTFLFLPSRQVNPRKLLAQQGALPSR